MRRVLAAMLLTLATAAPPALVQAQETVARARDCPEGLPAGTRCYSGRSAAGAWYWAAYPTAFNGSLIVHAHGGPRTGEPGEDDPVEDLQRFSMMVQAGYAWVGSAYRRGGYGVRMAAEDTDQVRAIAWARFGRPQRTILHGQSWGGNVAAKAAELYAVQADGTRNYDGVLLTSGLLAGGSDGYDFRADLRAVYQFYCNNHPRPDEAQYPLWRGLPEGASMSRAELSARVDECTGASLAPAARSAQQASNLRNIVSVTGVPADQLVAHLNWATTLFQDLVGRGPNAGNPFSNIGRTYRGSDDDVALNQGVQRFAADPAAAADLAYDADLTGLISIPTLTLHARYDPTVYIWHEAAYRETVAAAGRSDLLVQVVTTEAEHSRLSAPQYLAALDHLSAWMAGGPRPTAQNVADRCETWAEATGEPCRIDPDFVPDLQP